LDFEIRLKEIEEIYPELKAAEITNYLAQLKSSAFEGELKEILITSDTMFGTIKSSR
jgi:septum formation protein